MLCDDLEGWKGRVEERLRREGLYVYIWLIYVYIYIYIYINIFTYIYVYNIIQDKYNIVKQLYFNF